MKRLLKYIFAVAMAFFVVSSASAGKNDNWLLHPTFDLGTKRIIASNRMVYFLSPAQPVFENAPENAISQNYLYRYDTAKDEFHTLTNMNKLSETIVKDITLNARRGYLMVIYDSGNIDLLYDNGKVYNIPGLMNASIPASKNINSVFFDHANNRAFLATDFGFVEINDKKAEISDSRIYDRKLLSFGVFGDYYFAVSEDGTLYRAPLSSPIYDFNDFEIVENMPVINNLYPVSHQYMLLSSNHQVEDPEDPENFIEMTEIYSLGLDENNEFTFNLVGDFQLNEIEANSRGYILNTPRKAILISRNTNPTEYAISSSDKESSVASWDMQSFWFAKERSGFYSKKFRDGSLVDDVQLFMPNSSAAFKCTSIEHHPSKGMLVSNHGNDFFFQSNFARSPLLLSSLKNYKWDKIGLPYINPRYSNVFRNPNGMAIDPNYPKYVYFGSNFSGIIRMNLEDQTDILKMTAPADNYLNTLPSAIICDTQVDFDNLIRFSAPHFDASGNLWTMHSNLNSPAGKQNELWVWPRANSAATKDYTDVKPWLKIVPPTSELSNSSICLPLSHSSNKNLVIVSLNSYMGEMVIVDHKGTLDVTSDDTFTTLPLKPVDQDGQTVNRIYVRALYEDPTTGLVWVTTDSGVFTFNPRTAQQNPNLVNRIKVARNDGTSLADYLLNGVDVFNMTSDTQGRKWFATNGAGLVCTSSDGRTVLGEYTTENSGIPSDEVYAAGWNPENGSILISTSLGLAELSPYGAGSGETLDSARAYPNPVRPDFFGWVTIDGLVDNALVKITDAEGNTVRELGNAPGGTVQWDVCDMNMKRVKSGVYYILASSGPNSSSMAKVTKLLVVN